MKRARTSSGDRRSLASRILVLQLVLLLAVVVPGWALAVRQAQVSARAEAIARARATVLTVAQDPAMLAAVLGPDPAAALAGPVERVRAANDIGFLVAMSPDGIRYTHPDPAEVGGKFQGTITGAQHGRITVEDYTGTLGRSVRVVAPVRDGDGHIVALLSAGVPLTSIADAVRASALQLGLLALGALALGTLGAALMARRLHQQTHGLGPVGLARLHSYHDALLHSVRSGLILIGHDRTVVLCNDEARRLLDAPQVTPGAAIASLGLDAGLGELMSSGRDCDGEVYPTASRTLVVTQKAAALDDGGTLGWVTTLSDRTDLVRLTGELDSLRTFTDSLRARAHEADNRLHTVVMLVELGEHDEAVAFATATLVQTQALVDLVTSAVEEPPLAALMLGKAAQSDERGVSFELAPDTLIPTTGLTPGDLVVIVGNLVDNAIDAAADAPAPRWVRVGGRQVGDQLVIEVEDSGPGLPADLVRHAFTRGWTTKSDSDVEDRPQGRGIGLALVQGTVRRLGGTIEVRRVHGACFTVRLPVPMPQRPAITPVGAVAEPIEEAP
ncbi:sensor histidine kinase [Pengzhenrongella sp.]|jgi:sensor histidine kinase regulating citrate/malate metabolism|uniref:sensor histidine kinase n=1 Tax=Pengzhenrongella sp. TaxID=2888820 RepID=UPI002F95CEE7